MGRRRADGVSAYCQIIGGYEVLLGVGVRSTVALGAAFTGAFIVCTYLAPAAVPVNDGLRAETRGIDQPSWVRQAPGASSATPSESDLSGSVTRRHTLTHVASLGG